MKFKNFNLKDVLGRDETEEAKVYVGKLGYFANDLDDLDHAITYIPEQTHELVTIKQTGTDNKYVARLRAFKYFLPLDKVKKTEPTKTNTEFNIQSIPLGKVIRVFTSNLCITGEFSGTTSDAISMKDVVVKTPKEKFNAISASIKIEHIEKIKVLIFSNNKFIFSELKIEG